MLPTGLAVSDLPPREAMKSGLFNQIPAGRFGETVEIADALVYFASDESGYAVGSELIIDGGIRSH